MRKNAVFLEKQGCLRLEQTRRQYLQGKRSLHTYSTENLGPKRPYVKFNLSKAILMRHPNFQSSSFVRWDQHFPP